MQKSAQSDSEAVSKAEAAAIADSPFVFEIDSSSTEKPDPVDVKPAEPDDAPAMETVSTIEFTPEADDSPTKPVSDINSILFTSAGSGVLAQAIAESKEKEKEAAKETTISDLKEEPEIPAIPVVSPAAPAAPAAPEIPVIPVAEPAPVAPVVIPPAPAVVNKPEEIVFAPGEVVADAGVSDKPA